MSTLWSEWLATLGTQRADLKPAVRGQLFGPFTITHPGDVTGDTLLGSVRAETDSTTALATFTIGTPSFSDGVTTWTYSLPADGWANVPADADGNGVEVLPYDFILDGQRIFGGLFTVSGHITEPA